MFFVPVRKYIGSADTRRSPKGMRTELNTGKEHVVAISVKPYGTDANGETPEVGDFVAYNYSGNIATGFIKRIGRTTKGWHRNIYYVEQVAPTKGHESVIRGGAMCLLILEKGGGLVKGFFDPEN